MIDSLPATSLQVVGCITVVKQLSRLVEQHNTLTVPKTQMNIFDMLDINLLQFVFDMGNELTFLQIIVFGVQR